MALIGPMKYLTIGGSTYEILGLEITSSAITSALGYTPYNGSTNPNGYITSFTDEKLKTTAVTSGITYYPIVGSNSTTAANKNYDSTGFSYKGDNGTTSVQGWATITLGNNTTSGTANNKTGVLQLFSNQKNSVSLRAVTLNTTDTATHFIDFRAQSGTVAYLTDIPNVSGKIDTAGTGLSKSGTTLNHSNSVTAQTTQAIYPIKIDAQGHISAYGTAVTPLTASSTLDATKLSGTIPAACYTDTDTKVTNTIATLNTTYYLTGSTSSSTTTGELSKHDSLTAYTTADSYTSGYTELRLGNTTATTSAGGKVGQIRLYGTGATYYTTITPGAVSGNNKTITLPNATGTVALTSDIPTVPDVSGKIDTAGTGLSKSGTTLNHSNSITAQSTQAVYPIKIDAQGHISAYGSAVTIPSDINVTSTAVTANTWNYLVGSTNSSTETGTLSKHASAYIFIASDSSTNGYTQLRLGNTTATSSAGGKEGQIRLYGTNATYYVDIVGGAQTNNHTLTLPDKAGIVALTTDIPTKVSHLTNDSGFVTSDTNVTSTAVTAATTNYITGSTTSTTTTGTLSKHASALIYTTTDSSTSGYTQLRLGNTTATSSAGGKEGQIRLYGTNATYYVDIKGGAQTTNHILTLPNKTDTVAVLGDIPTVPDVSGKIDTAGTGLSKSGTTLNHSNSVTAKTTQAIYPIKFDAQGHITGAGDAVTINSISAQIIRW